MNANNRRQRRQRAIIAAMKTALVIGGAAITGAILPQSGAWADQALVIGINDYPNLEGANLKGCVNDAKDMTAALTRMGFKVTSLLNEQATKQNIVAALSQMKAQVKPNEKFVFYYAGHGTQQSDGDAVLLPHNAEETSEVNDFKADDLHNALKAIPAVSRTALLDSCYSGGMMRAFSRVGKPQMTTRSHRRRMTGSGGVAMRDKDFVKANRADTPDTGAGGDTPDGGGGGISTTGGGGSASGGGSRLNPETKANPSRNTANNSSSGGDIRDRICYFTAASRNEQAGEDDFDSNRHGVFTHFLIGELAQAQPGRVLWGDMQTKVASNVSEYMEDLQHPRLTPEFTSTPLFVNGANSAPPAPTTKPSNGDGGGGGTQVAVVTPKPNTNGGGGNGGNTKPKPNPEENTSNGGGGTDKPNNGGGGLSTTGGNTAPAVKPVTTHTLWDMYSSDQADAKRLLLTIEPDKTTLKVNEQVSFKTRVGMSGGYLVILNRGVSGNVNMLYPESGKIDDAKVTPGRLFLIPEDGSKYYPDRAGTERLKAVLFTDRALADEFLKKFNELAAKTNGQGSRSVHWVRMRDAKLSRPLRDAGKMRDAIKPFYTSDVIAEVVSE